MKKPTKRPLTIKHLKSKIHFDKKALVVIGVIFAALGSYVIIRSFAASQSIINVAIAEIGVIENPKGSNSGGRVDLYTNYTPEPWCADFISWVYKTAGRAFTGGYSGGWRINNVTNIENWFKSNGRWYSRTSGVTPLPGDAVSFRWSSAPNDTHIGIVEYVVNGTLYTIEGNGAYPGDDRVARHSYLNYAADSRIVGWGRPRSGGPAVFTIRTSGLPSGAQVSVTSQNHDIGYCTRSGIPVKLGSLRSYPSYTANAQPFSSSMGVTVCESGMNSYGQYYPIGTTDGLTNLVFPRSYGSYVFDHYQFDSGQTGRNAYFNSLWVTAGGVNGVTLYYKYGGGAY